MRTKTTAAAALNGILAAFPDAAIAPRDGTPGNPPGTAAGRAADRALGTNTTGANPGASAPAR